MTQYKTKIIKTTLKKKKKACATCVSQSWREEGKASKVTKLEKEKNSKQKAKSAPTGVKVLCSDVAEGSRVRGEYEKWSFVERRTQKRERREVREGVRVQ